MKASQVYVLAALIASAAFTAALPMEFELEEGYVLIVSTLR